MERSFSERMNLKPQAPALQLNSMTVEFRMDLYNAFYGRFYTRDEISLMRYLWSNVFKLPMDEFKSAKDTLDRYVKPTFLEEPWNEVYDVLESTINWAVNWSSDADKFILKVNEILKSHRSAYSLMNGIFIPIASDEEVATIMHTEIISVDYGLVEVKKHLDRALELLSSRPTPDCRNSIKESVSMVGSLARRLESTNDLSSSIHKLAEKGVIDRQLCESFKKIYHYASGQGGMRHELLPEGVEPDMKTAKFVLVVSSAFSNYLLAGAIDNKLIQ